MGDDTGLMMLKLTMVWGRVIPCPYNFTQSPFPCKKKNHIFYSKSYLPVILEADVHVTVVCARPHHGLPFQFLLYIIYRPMKEYK